jgi:hypothetical protein
VHVDLLGVRGAHREATLSRRTRLDRLLPTLQVGKMVDLLTLPFPAQGPADAGDIGD